MRFEAKDDEPVDVQMTPMIDCVFLLLIFFLVATVMKRIDKELDVELPESAAAIEVQKDEDALVIGISAAGEYYLNGDPVSLSMLHGELRRVGEENPDRSVRIDGDRSAVMQHLIHILDLCRFEGLTNVGIHTRKETASRRSTRKRKRG